MRPAEVTIRDAEVQLHRIVVNPAWVQDGALSPQAFLPRPQDQSRLSVTDKGLHADEALERWRQRFPRSRAQSVATVTVGDCLRQGLAVIDDSGADDHHASIDYSAVAEVEAAAFHLSAAASLWP